MDIVEFVEAVSLSTLVVLTALGVFYTVKTAIGSGCCNRIFRCRRCTGVSETQPDCTGCVSSFRPQDYIFRQDADSRMDVTAVFIDQNDYQQLYLKNLKRQQQMCPSAPPSSLPPPYESA